ncbi:MAG TPA: ATP-binding protein, partial [Actinomycetota bacterium]|nr:ATP-binding protein [Actinomycetota bacterium]
LVEATQAAQDALRRVVRDLRDSSLGPGGLHRALKALVRNVESAGSARIIVEADEVEGEPLVQLLAYQIIREALQNAVKHSSASSIRVSVRSEEAVIRILVEDDGVGFSQYTVDCEKHFGLQLMRERAEAAGGHLYIDSAPGAGTRVVASLPTGSGRA